MISRKKMLNELPPSPDSYEVLADDQDVEDIMLGIEDAHIDYAYQYDMIFENFIGSTPEQTCKNIWKFLRNNVSYYEETADDQTVRSAASILEVCQFDCKNYTLFTGGVLDAINRSGQQKIPFVYRFASDDLLQYLDPFSEMEAGHVFVVAFPGTDNEIWIDAIPQIRYFNEHPDYYYELDKKITVMPLYKVSGIRRGQQMGSLVSTASDIVTSVVPYAGVAKAVFSLFSSGSQPNPYDWKGGQDGKGRPWTSGDAKLWTKQDGDNVKNEALNIAYWINAQGTTKGVEAMINSDDNGVTRVTIEQIADKFRRGGLEAQAEEIESYYFGENVSAPPIPSSGGSVAPGTAYRGAYNPATGRYDTPPAASKTPSWVAPVAVVAGGVVLAKIFKLI